MKPREPAHVLALQLERSGYFPAVRDMAKGFSAPLWWHDASRPAGERIVRSGTACFVNTGRKDLLVTCNHVYVQWLADRATMPNLRCQIGAAVLEPESRLIDRDGELDLAVFDSSEVLASSAFANIHHSITWPPAPLVEGEVVMLGGFAGQYRFEDERQPTFNFVSFVTKAGDVSKERVVYSLQLDNTFSTQGLTLRKDFTYGGASGGPVYRVREDQFGILELVGFIYQYAPSLDALLTRPASLVSAEGLLSRVKKSA